MKRFTLVAAMAALVSSTLLAQERNAAPPQEKKPANCGG